VCTSDVPQMGLFFVTAGLCTSLHANDPSGCCCKLHKLSRCLSTATGTILSVMHSLFVVCAAGWTYDASGACQQPLGYCSRFPTNTSSLALFTAPPAFPPPGVSSGNTTVCPGAGGSTAGNSTAGDGTSTGGGFVDTRPAQIQATNGGRRDSLTLTSTHKQAGHISVAMCFCMSVHA
jgi:hypothetical protein